MKKPVEPHNLQDLLKQTIWAGFPELVNLLRAGKIRIKYKPMKDAWMQVRHPGDGHGIEVDKKLGKAPLPVVTGALAHELAHIIDHLNKTPLQLFVAGLCYRLQPGYLKMMERNTDLEAILRGFGPQLLAFMEYTDGNHEFKEEDDGLSLKQLRLLIPRK